MTANYNGTWESVNTHRIPDWYEDCKFGIFIHWGIYSVPAYAPRTWELGTAPSDEEWFANNPYAEWYFNSVNIGHGPTYDHHAAVYGKDFKYKDFAPMWKAEHWRPEHWADLFKRSGAGYVVMVTKHHDGFCLFPSKYTAYHAGNIGPKRDLVGDLTRAVRGQGLRMGFYYSGMLDWTFARDPILRGSENFTKACPTFEYADYAYKQSCELIDIYKPSVFWNDIGWPKQGELNLPYLLAHYYNTVPEGVVNDRWSGLYQDFTTREYQYGEAHRDAKWEMNRGMGLSFGYNAEEGDDKILSVEDAVSLLVSTVANNGNLLLNIGPRADGLIPVEQEKRLLAIGEWLSVNGEAIYGSRCSRRVSRLGHDGLDIHFTRKGEDLYVILDRIPRGPFTVLVPEVHKKGEALDGSLQSICEVKAEGLSISLGEHGDSGKAVVFRVHGGE
jgi:alpha-L-fucosidase